MTETRAVQPPIAVRTGAPECRAKRRPRSGIPALQCVFGTPTMYETTSTAATEISVATYSASIG